MITFRNPSFAEVSKKEWIVTNGLGGYASSTLSGANTRRYHGLLVASLRPPTDRIVIVSKIEETIISHDGNRIELSANQYPGAIHPQGHQLIKGFERQPLPSIYFEAGSYKLSKTILMVSGSNTSVVVYENLGKNPLQLELNPLYVYRDYHSLFKQDERFDFYRAELDPSTSVIYPFYGAPALYVKCMDSSFHPHSIWYKDMEYPKETYRGLDDHEDVYSNGTYQLSLIPGQKAYIIFSLDWEMMEKDGADLLAHEMNRLAGITEKIPNSAYEDLPIDYQRFYADLVLAGDQFIVDRASNEGQSIIAGYHWFTDWGRDTMISMRGLVIAAGNQKLAKSIIRTYLMYLKDGLIPNRFPDQGELPEYNTIDASLWLFIALKEYHAKFQDIPFLKECLPKLNEILTAYRDGTHFGIHMTTEGLVFGGEGLSQLTWMDAKVGDYVVTPRHGCPVEINALWYNALRIYIEFQKSCKDQEGDWNLLVEKVRVSFRRWFINSKGYLNDVVIPQEYADDAFRPNQLYALSLPFPMLDEEESEILLGQISDKLFTPYGMRSLAMDHPDFVPVYAGDQWHRDSAYHQGTVWTFLIGEYFLSYLKMHKPSVKAKKQVLEMMSGLKEHFYQDDCIHGISEIFDGEKPGPGRGCIHQAWSVGMLLLVFDALRNNP